MKDFQRYVKNALIRAYGAALPLWTGLGRARRRRQAETRKKVTLFLALEAGLDPFFASHALLAKVLNEAGGHAILLSCNGLQPTCSAKMARQINQTPPGDANHLVCVRCRAIAAKVGHDYGLADFSLESVLTPQMRAEIEHIIASHATRPWEAEYDGIAIGGAALGEALRTQRRLDLSELTPPDVDLIAALLYSALAVYMAVKALSEGFEIERIAYCGDYAYFIAPQILARRLNIPVTNISHAYNRDIDRRFLNLRRGHAFNNMLEQIDDWDEHRNTPVPAEALAEIADGGLFRLHGAGGASTYSPNWKRDPGDLLKELGLPPGGKVLVAFSNSTDELLCNREILRVMGIPYYSHTPNPFESQLDWLSQLTRWVGERPDLRLIIRLHPRMAKGHRHKEESSEAAHMRRELAVLPPNVAVIWPESKMSSYNIAEHAMAALTAWSSIGLELARFGMPVISAFQRVGPWPNDSFNWFSETRAGYFDEIERALVTPPSLAPIKAAFRWTHYLHWAPLVDVSDVIPEPNYSYVPPWRTPRNTKTLLKVLVDNTDLISMNMAALPRDDAAVHAEQDALLAALGRTLLYFLSGDFSSQPRGYRLAADGREVAIGKPDVRDPLFQVTGEDQIVMTHDDERISRKSRLAARLARCVIAG